MLGKGEVLGKAWIMTDLEVDKEICVRLRPCHPELGS